MNWWAKVSKAGSKELDNAGHLPASKLDRLFDLLQLLVQNVRSSHAQSLVKENYFSKGEMPVQLCKTGDKARFEL